MKMKEPQLHAKIWLNLSNISMNERKVHLVCLYLYQVQTQRDEVRAVVTWGEQ